MRDVVRDAVLSCKIPLEAARASSLLALDTASAAAVPLPALSATRAFLTALRTELVMLVLRALRLIRCRFRFSAEG